MRERDKATEELCTILDALGWIGDDRAIPLARKYAERKLLSRRRSGVGGQRDDGVRSKAPRGRHVVEGVDLLRRATGFGKTDHRMQVGDAERRRRDGIRHATDDDAADVGGR